MAKGAGKWFACFIDDSGTTARDLSNDLIAINGAPLNYNPVEVGGFQQDMMFVIGRGDSELQLTFLFNDTATTGSHTVLNSIDGSNTAGTVTLQFGDNAAPTTGDPEFEGEMICTSYQVIPDLNGAITSTATFKPGSGASLPAWGTVS